jgi:hypothetical protein
MLGPRLKYMEYLWALSSKVMALQWALHIINNVHISIVQSTVCISAYTTDEKIIHPPILN